MDANDRVAIIKELRNIATQLVVSSLLAGAARGVIIVILLIIVGRL